MAKWVASSCRSLPEVLIKNLELHPQNKVFTLLGDGENESASLTYQDLDLKARALAAMLQERSLVGERALLVYPQNLDFYVAFFGCLYAGTLAVPVSVPTSRKKSALDRLLAVVHDARPRVALTTPELLPTLKAAAGQIPGLESLEWIASNQIDDQRASDWRSSDLTRDDIAFLQYTSGSTASPRGVRVSHGNIICNMEMIHRAFDQDEATTGVCWLPLHHDMGLIKGLQHASTGMHTVVMPALYFLQKPVRWLSAISKYRAHTSGGPNFGFELCIRKVTIEQSESLDLSSWRIAFNGAEPVRSETLERFAERFAPQGFRAASLYPCYGMAEATLFISGASADTWPLIKEVDNEALQENRIDPAREGERSQKQVSSGHPWLSQKVEIVDPSLHTRCAEGRIGEIWIQGDNVAHGYWNRPDANNEIFAAELIDDPGAGKFLRTGDLGFLQDGELFIAGRLKDVVIIAGQNYYPQDIEKTVEESHSNVRPGCSVAFAVDRGDAEKLVVVAEVREAYDLDQTKAAIRRAVSEVHELRIHDIALIQPRTLSKTTSGKVQRRLSRKLYLEEALSLVAQEDFSLALPRG